MAPDKSLYQQRTTIHHHPQNLERALNLSILAVSGSGEISRVESNSAAGALPSIPLSFNFAIILLPRSLVGTVYSQNLDGI